MQLNQLFEYKETSGGTIEDLYNKYKDRAIMPYYVIFSDSKTNFSASGISPYTDTIAAIPIRYFINNINKFKRSKKKYVSVVSLVGNGLLINKLNLSQYLSIMAKMGVSVSDISKELLKTHDYGDIIMNKLNGSKPLGYDYIVDSSKSSLKSYLNSSYPSIAFIFKSNSINVIETFDVNINVTDKYSDTLSISELASNIANAMDTVISDEPPVKYFTEFYFWTVDGIEVKITESMDDHEGKNSYFIIECDTPNGILLYTTDPSDSYEDIQKEVKDAYNNLTIHNTEWKPMSRDLFLSGNRYMFKMLDSQSKDIVTTIDKWYPIIRSLGMKHSILLPEFDTLSRIGKIELFIILNKFVFENENALEVLEEYKEDGIDELVGRSVSNEITYELVENVIKIYNIGKKFSPQKSGWIVFDALQ